MSTRTPSRRRARTTRLIRSIAVGAVLSTAIGASAAAPSASASTPAPVSVLDAGAVPGDGLDDLAAFEAAAQAARAKGTYVSVPAGTFHLSGVLVLDSVGLTGVGRDATRVVSTDPWASAIGLTGKDVGLAALTHVVPDAGARAARLGVQNVVVQDASGFVVRNLRLIGAKGSGLLVRSSSSGRVRDNEVADTQADGIHITAGTYDVFVRGNLVRNTGDDGIAVVSYERDASPSHDILITQNTVKDGLTRGLSVVGGHTIGLTENTVTRSAMAGVYIASEAEWSTRAVEEVHVARNVITSSPTNASGGHSAVLVYASGNSVDRVWFQQNRVDRSPTTGFGAWTRRSLPYTGGSIGTLLYSKNSVTDAVKAPTRFMAGDIRLHGNEGF